MVFVNNVYSKLRKKSSFPLLSKVIFLSKSTKVFKQLKNHKPFSSRLVTQIDCVLDSNYA